MTLPEQAARETIDAMLADAGWTVQSRAKLNLGAARGVAVREFALKTGFADYLLFVDRKAIGAVEAKPTGTTLSGIEAQSEKYGVGLPALPPAWRKPLPFLYESTGVETFFTNGLDPAPRSRRVFSFHRPDTLAAWVKEPVSLRGRLQMMRDAVILAYERVSKSIQVSIPDQKRAIEEDAARFGWEVKRHRWDVGSRWDNERPDYRGLHEDIESRQFTHFWLFNADRLGGDDLEYVATIRKARKYGMVVRDTVHGEIIDDMASILRLQSYWEIKNTHYRVMLKLEGKHLEGVKLGSVPTGYKPQCRLHPCRCGLHGKHVPAEPWASWVQELFARYAGGESLRSVRQWWNAETGERTSHIRIKDMLRNPYYVGIVVNCRRHNGKVQGRGKRSQEEWKVGTHEHPLIDLRTFATVQERLRTQENVGQERQTYPADPLVGLLHCVSCRCRLRRKIDAKARKRGRTMGQWECPICNLSRAQLKVQRAIHGLLAAIPFPEDAAIEDYAQQQARLQQRLEQELKAIVAERDRHNRRRSVWADALGDGTMSKEDY
jgi:DNA invertase Pin-like site-specific DNA recombinase